MKKLIDTLTWEEFAQKVMHESALNTKSFYKWLMSKKYLGGTFFCSAMWRKQYEIYRQINYTNDDCVEIVAGLEGWGKSKLARQKLSVVDPTFCKERIFKDREDMYNWYYDNEGKTKGKGVQVDEGGNFFNARENMGKENIKFMKFLQNCRQTRTYIVICIPDYMTVDKYVREHRSEYLTQIIRKHNSYKLINKEGIDYITSKIKKNVPYKYVRLKKNSFFIGNWNSEEPKINDLTEKKYEEVKNEAWKGFLKELINDNKNNQKNFLSVSELSKISGIGGETIRNKIKDGSLQAIRPFNKFMIPKDEAMGILSQ